LAHQRAVHEPGRIAEYQNDDFGCVTEAVVADGHEAHDRRGQLIQEQQPERKPAEKIEPEIALDQNDGAHVSDLSRSKPVHRVGLSNSENSPSFAEMSTCQVSPSPCPVYNARSMRE